VYFTLQPIPVFEHLPNLSVRLSPWLEQLLKLLVGGAAGSLIGSALGVTISARNLLILAFAFSLTGIVLGWQALFQVTIVFALLAAICGYLSKTRFLLGRRPTTLLLIAIAIHHPFWKTLANCWRFN
jgi:hypothetical protein